MFGINSYYFTPTFPAVGLAYDALSGRLSNLISSYFQDSSPELLPPDFSTSYLTSCCVGTITGVALSTGVVLISHIGRKILKNRFWAELEPLLRNTQVNDSEIEEIFRLIPPEHREDFLELLKCCNRHELELEINGVKELVDIVKYIRNLIVSKINHSEREALFTSFLIMSPQKRKFVFQLSHRLITPSMGFAKRMRMIEAAKEIFPQREKAWAQTLNDTAKSKPVGELISCLMSWNMRRAELAKIIENVINLYNEETKPAFDLMGPLVAPSLSAEIVKNLINLSLEEKNSVFELLSKLMNSSSGVGKLTETIEDIINLPVEEKKPALNLIIRLIIPNESIEELSTIIKKAMNLSVEERKSTFDLIDFLMKRNGGAEAVENLIKLSTEDRNSLFESANHLITITSKMNCEGVSAIFDNLIDIPKKERASVMALVCDLVTDGMDHLEIVLLMREVTEIYKLKRESVVNEAKRLFTPEMDASTRRETINLVNHTSYLATSEMEDSSKEIIRLTLKDFPRDEREFTVDLVNHLITPSMSEFERVILLKTLRMFQVSKKEKEVVVELARRLITPQMTVAERKRLLQDISDFVKTNWAAYQLRDNSEIIESLWEILSEERGIDPLIFQVNSSQIAENFHQVMLEFFEKFEGHSILFPSRIQHTDSRGVDMGGLSRDFVTSVMKGFCNPSNVLFTMEAGEDGILPKLESTHLSSLEEQEKLYKMMGRLFNLALENYKSIVVGRYFDPVLFEMIFVLSEDDLKRESSHEVFDKLLKVYLSKKYAGKITDSDIENIIRDNLTEEFTDIFGAESRKEFLDEYKIEEKIKAAIIIAKSMRHHLRNKSKWDYSIKGDSALILGQKIEGVLSAAELIRALEFNNSSNQVFVNYFHKFINEASLDKLEKFVELITGSKALSFGKKLNVKFYSSPNEDTLPVAHTCFFSIDLPTNYSSYEVFKQKLDLAIEHGLGDGFQIA